MDTAFIIGNGETRLIFPINKLKGKGVIYGCNAIYRDYPTLCDYIMAVDPSMIQEMLDNEDKYTSKLLTLDDIPEWNYKLDDDPKAIQNLFGREWMGGDVKTGKMKSIDFTESKGTGCSAVLHAAEAGHKEICIFGFDILGTKQWEMGEQEMSRPHNNIYKNTANYPKRVNMKAYLKYEWLFHLRQLARKYTDVNFYFFNRREYITMNPLLVKFLGLKNYHFGIYADLKRWIDGEKNNIKWMQVTSSNIQ